MAGKHDALVAEAIANEKRLHKRRLELLRDREFVEGSCVGLEEEHQGKGIPLAEARRLAHAHREKVTSGR